MANSENPKPFFFVNERGQNIVDRRNPNDLSHAQLEKLLEEAIQSALHGNPIRIHVVFPSTVYILTEQELSKVRTSKEAEDFKNLEALHLAYSKEIFILRQPNQSLKKSPFEEFVKNNPSFAHLDKA